MSELKTIFRRVVPVAAGALLLLATLAAPLYLAGNFAVRAAPDHVAIQTITLGASPITATSTFSGGRWAALGTDQPPTIVEVWLAVDQDVVNTATFALQVSPDNTTWLDHNTAGALATDVVADTSTYTRTTAEGVFYRIVATLANNETLTPTIKVVLR